MATAVVGAPKCVSGTKQLKKVSVGIWKAVSSATGTGTSCQPMRTARAKGRTCASGARTMSGGSPGLGHSLLLRG